MMKVELKNKCISMFPGGGGALLDQPRLLGGCCCILQLSWRIFWRWGRLQPLCTCQANTIKYHNIPSNIIKYHMKEGNEKCIALKE